MNCIHNELKLPKAKNLDLVKCVKVTMSDDTEYMIKENDLVGIQFIKNDTKILVRRGRIKDIVVVNKRELSTITDNVSRIILDCSEQFSVKILEIKFSDIIKIGNIDDEFDDYEDRITELNKSCIDENKCKIPMRQGGMSSIPRKGVPVRK